MAPAVMSALLQPRYTECVNGFCTGRSRWSDWGRWIVLGIIVFAILLAAFACSCLARRRRRRGAQPMYGTGWMAPPGISGGHLNQPMNNYQQGYAPQNYPPGPPAYGQPQQQQYTGTTGTTFHPNDGYYGDPAQPQQQQQYGGVQQPPNTHQREPAYSPPPGPPPGK